MKRTIRLAITFALFAAVGWVSAQTVTPNESVIVQPNTYRVGMNIGDTNWYSNGNVYKNVWGQNNPHMEPLEDRRVWALPAAGTTTTFASPINYDNYPANYWAGATFQVIAVQSGGAELNCTGTIASNTGPNWPGGGSTSPVFTTSAPCAAPFSIGDIIVLFETRTPTVQSDWESNYNGLVAQVSGGGHLLSDNSNLCATCGTQALQLSAASGSAGFQELWDADNTNVWRRINGTYAVSYDAKVISGSPTLSINVNRSVAGGFNCSPTVTTPTTSWVHYSTNCTISEPLGQTPGTAQGTFTVTGGVLDIDNVDFENANGNPANITDWDDDIIADLVTTHPGTFRDWLTLHNGLSLQNWTAPDYARGESNSGTQAFGQPAYNGTHMPSLYNEMVIAQYIGSDPYLEVPSTWQAADYKNLIDFIAGDGTTTYGAKRIALGQTAPWTTVFNTIHLSFCNECWNVSFAGSALFFRGNAPSGVNFNGLYWDYAQAMYLAFGAMRSSAFYNSSKFDLVANAQTAQTFGWDYFLAQAPHGSAPDSIEIEGYWGNTVNQFDTDAHIWGPAFTIPWDRSVNPSDTKNWYQSMHDYQSQTTCGPAGTSTCKVNSYEWGQGTIAGSLTQTIQDEVNAGSGDIVVDAILPLLNTQTYGMGPQNYFSLTEYVNGGSNSNSAKLWGCIVDAGGATGNVRPCLQVLGLINKSIIGAMYSCPLSGTYTQNFAGNTNNGDNVPPGTPAINNVPYIYAFCFKSSSSRSMVLVNSDFSSHGVTLAGAQAPAGTVTTRQMAPSSPDLINESHTGSPTNTATMQTSIATSSGAATGSVTLAPFSVTALDWTSGSTPVASTPTFSPGAGTYGSAQSVTVSTTSSGAILCGNTTNSPAPATNGSTGCASGSTLYSGPISVASSETLYYVAGGTGFLDSSVGTAAYTIGGGTVATPTFSPGAGTYTSAQSVTISTATSSAVICYTTDGTTPTATTPGTCTHGTTYSGAVPVSSSQTLKAIGTLSGDTNSSIASAAYTINIPASVNVKLLGTGSIIGNGIY